MTQRQRQLDELRELCEIGAIGRAIDLAYEHFADFGPAEEITVLIASSMTHFGATDAIRHKFDELLATHQ